MIRQRFQLKDFVMDHAFSLLAFVPRNYDKGSFLAALLENGSSSSIIILSAKDSPSPNP
jgi:hypothetical protein